MGIFEGANRNATARAKGDLSALLVNEKEFMQKVGETPRLAKHLLNRLSARLRVTSKELADALATDEDDQDKGAEAFPFFGCLDSKKETRRDSASLVLLPNTQALAEQIPGIGVSINEFPFLVGRKSDDTSESRTGKIIVPLQLNDFSPYRLSRVHFMIQRADDVFVIRDMGSALGTAVNGHSMGVDFPRDSMKLEVGENVIVAGGADSHFSFKLNIPKI